MKEYKFNQFTGTFKAANDTQAIEVMKAIDSLLKVIKPDEIVKLGKMVSSNPAGWNMYKKMLGF
jgi:hypothetical protein